MGAAPELVPGLMDRFKNLATSALQCLDSINAPLTPGDKLKHVVAVACSIFDMFLRIHPYANGNGHIARLILTAILLRYGHRPKKLPVHPKPPAHSPYSSAIAAYQSGNPLPLQEYIVDGIIG